MPQPPAPFYLDWTFWAVVIAALAVVLSQLPPLKELLRPGRVSIELYSRIAVGHKVGNPNIQEHVILRNAGGRAVMIGGMFLRIRRDKKDIAVLPGQTYLQQPNDTSTVLLTSFTLKAKDEWAHIVNFLEFFQRTDEKKYRAAEQTLKNDIAAKKQLPQNKDKIVDGEPEHVAPLLAMFDEKFIWQAGEYDVEVVVEAADHEVFAKQKYRFTLYESDSDQLTSSKNGFKIGDGIFYNSGNYPYVLAQLAEG